MCETILADVTDGRAVEQAVRAAEGRSGPIDILINSAGITGITNTKSHEVDPGEGRAWFFGSTFFGSFHTARAVLPGMIRRNYGRVLHIASIAGKEGNAGMMAYSASKAAVIGMTKTQGKELAETGVTVNALAPAVIRTPMVEALPAAQVTYMTDKIPMKLRNLGGGRRDRRVHYFARCQLHSPDSSSTSAAGGRRIRGDWPTSGQRTGCDPDRAFCDNFPTSACVSERFRSQDNGGAGWMANRCGCEN